MSIYDLSLTGKSTPIFLETGTFHGGGVRSALKIGYEKIISIEVYEPLYRENLERFSKEIASGQVELHMGDSGLMLGDVVKDLELPITFWFDAHDQTMNNAGVGELKCPIVKELRSIIDNRSLALRESDILLIDDMRLIENPGPGWEVDMTVFYKILWEYNMKFSVQRIEGHVPHDIILAR